MWQLPKTKLPPETSGHVLQTVELASYGISTGGSVLVHFTAL
jgi:hypothetical protein